MLTGEDVGVLVVDPRVEPPRRMPMRDVEPDMAVPPVVAVVVDPAIEVVDPPDSEVVVPPDARVSICCRICISNDNDPPDDVVGVVVVVVVAPHSVLGVVETVCGVDVVPSLEVPYTPREVRSEKVVGVDAGAVTTLVVVPHPGSDPLARSSLTTLGGIAM